MGVRTKANTKFDTIGRHLAKYSQSAHVLPSFRASFFFTPNQSSNHTERPT